MVTETLKKKLLIVDDEEINRMTLEAGFNDSYEVLQAENGKIALEYLYKNDIISAVLLDINMPEMNGFEVLRDLNETGLITKIPVFIITAENNDDELLKAYELGAVDIISKPYNIRFLRRHVANTIELYSQRNNLSKIVEEKTAELIRQNNRLVEAMADIVEFRSNESGTHVKRVSGYTRILMEGLIHFYPEYKYLYNDIESISFASCLHDLGKIAIPDAVLNKPGRYNDDEFAVMKTHTTHGYEQVLALKDIMAQKLYDYSIDIVRHHHERYDGRGYPDGLAGEEITIWSQAVALSDVYDALTSKRCYKEEYDHETSCSMILNGECGAFNPKIIDVFQRAKEKMNQLRLGITRKRILIVDDSLIDRSILRTILTSEYDVDAMDGGEAAVVHIQNSQSFYDAVVIDSHMPEMDGFELIRNLGTDFTARIPVLMCSSEITKEDMRKAISLGISSFLEKPFDETKVFERIKSVMETN